MRFLFKKHIAPFVQEMPSLKYPLSAICKIDSDGIHYIDDIGNQSIIEYRKAHKAWRRHKNTRNSKPKYICDRTRADGMKLIFHTKPPIAFYTAPEQKTLWTEIINAISRYHYFTFDID